MTRLAIWASLLLLASPEFAEADALTAVQIQQMVVQAAVNHQASVTIPAGVYHLAPAGGRYHLIFQNLANLTIDATGVTFICTNPQLGGIGFDHCSGITLTGATLEYLTPCFTQGTITAVGTGGKWIEVAIDRGWPSNLMNAAAFPATPAGYIFDPRTRLWKRGVYEQWLGAPMPAGAGRFRFDNLRQDNAGGASVDVGDLIAFRGVGSNGVLFNRSANMALDQVKILSSGGYGIFENGGDGGNRYQNVQVSYGPTPPGATTAPLLSANADGFHSTAVRHGPVIDSCLFEGMPDDGIAIHGLFALVLENNGALMVATTGADSFQAGDLLRFCSPDGSYTEVARITSRQEIPGYRPPRAITNPLFTGSANFHRFTLDRPVRAGFEDLLSDASACGPGYVLSNNIIRNHRARGMIVQGDLGMIEQNLIDGSTMAGIVIGPELGTDVAGYAHNVVIRFNTIRNVGYATTGPWEIRPGALNIAGEGENAAGRPGQVNFRINSNYFQDIDGVNIMIDSVRLALIRDNIFTNPQSHSSIRGRDAGINPNALIFLDGSDSVTIERNIVSTPPPNALIPILATSSVTNLIGANGGVVAGGN